MKRLYFEPYWQEGFDNAPRKKGDEPFATVPFFALARRGDALWATGADSVYRVTASGVKKMSAFGDFKVIDGIRVNFDSPDFVLVLTQVNQRRSVGGAVPMLVPR